MLLIIHIIIALLGVIVATVLVIAPSKQKLTASYSLAAGTLATGIILTISDPAHLAASCVSGIIYFSAIGVLIAISQRKLAKQKNN